MRTITQMTAVRWAIAAIVAILAVSGGSLLASGALASTAKPSPTKHSRLAVFSHPLTRTRIASASGVRGPLGAALAAVSSQKEVYAWQPTPAQETTPMRTADHGSSTCMVKVLNNGLESILCGPTTEVEERGLIGINLPAKLAPSLSVTALLPNGVTSVAVTDNDGSVHAVSVSNNAVILEDPNLASISYKLPNGGGINSASVSEAESMASRG